MGVGGQTVVLVGLEGGWVSHSEGMESDVNWAWEGIELCIFTICKCGIFADVMNYDLVLNEMK